MHLQLTRQNQPGTTFLHRLDPRTKILAAVASILILSLTPSGAFISYSGFYLLLAAVSMGSGLGLTWLLRRSFIAIPFALAAFRAGSEAATWRQVAAALAPLLLLPPATAYVALNFTGSSTFTSRTGVRREIFTYIPIMAWMFGSGVLFEIVLTLT